MSHPHAAGLEIVGADATVPLAGGGRIAYANLDHGASAPALRVVKDTVDALLERYASVHRGAGWHSKVCTSLYEGAREPVRDFVGGRADDAVIFTRHTTDSFNLLAHCLPARTTVVVFETEHHAALLPWDLGSRRRQTVVRLPAPGTPAEADRRRRRRAAAPCPRPGAAGDHRRLERHRRDLAGRRAGRRSPAPAAPGSRWTPPNSPRTGRSRSTELGVDYVALSGHKLYAPYGAGALVGRADWLAAAPPYLVGGGATASVTDDETTLQAAAGPARGRLAERPRRRRAGHRLPRAGHRRPRLRWPRAEARPDRDACVAV